MQTDTPAQSDFVKIACSIEARTEQAILIKHGERLVWIPLSQVEQELDEPVRGSMLVQTTAILVATWVAREKGLQATREDTATMDLFGGPST